MAVQVQLTISWKVPVELVEEGSNEAVDASYELLSKKAHKVIRPIELLLRILRVKAELDFDIDPL